MNRASDQTLFPPSKLLTLLDSKTAILFCAAIGLAGCGSYNPLQVSQTKFAPKDYGVVGSPKVAFKDTELRKGGGYQKIGKPYKIAGKWYVPKDYESYTKVGKASWYGPTFHGRLTANGEIFDRNDISAAHPTLPLPSYAEVTNLNNGRKITVRVNDRGPFHSNRIIDLSERTADLLDVKEQGTGDVRVVYLGKAPLHGKDREQLLASYNRPTVPSTPSVPSVLPQGPTPPGTIPRLQKADASGIMSYPKTHNTLAAYQVSDVDLTTGSVTEVISTTFAKLEKKGGFFGKIPFLKEKRTGKPIKLGHFEKAS